MKSPNTFNEALLVAQREAVNPSQNWAGYCQKFVRTTYGIPPLFSSAWAQWLGADDEDKHVGGHPDDAPLGSALCFKGTGPYGHIDLAARPFRSGKEGAWSNDLVDYGRIDKVLRTAPTSQWNQRYLGYLTAVNDYDLQLRTTRPAIPKQDKRYLSVDKAINNLERALMTAKLNHDTEDIETLQRNIRRLKKLYETLRHA